MKVGRLFDLTVILDESLSSGMARLVRDGEVLCTLFHLDHENEAERVPKALHDLKVMKRPEPDAIRIPKDQA